MKKLFIIFIITTVFAGCSPKKKISQDPTYDAFFEKARLIMTKEEISIYKHLPDETSKKEYIEEFWKKRDPTPETEENENKTEFEERIAYANRWFREGTRSATGWETERGRILLQLGFPDKREFGEWTPTTREGRLIGTKRYPMERWFYYRYQLYLIFIDKDSFGKLRLLRVPATLLTALDMAKFTLDLRNKAELKRAFKFDAEFKNNNIKIEIPVKKLSFEEADNKMISKFKIEIYVYLNYKKIDRILVEKIITKPKTEILNAKEINFEIPYSPSQKGSYYFDVIIEEMMTSSKYRNFCSTKF